MTADANNNNCRGRLPVTGKCVHVETQLYSGDIYGPLLLFLLHILYQCIDNVILFKITLNSNLNKSIVRALEREKQHTPHFPESRSNA